MSALPFSLIRSVDVISLVFHALQLLPIRFPHQNSCHISKSTMNHPQKPDRNRTSPQLVTAVAKCLFADFLTGYICPLSCIHYWVLNSCEYLKTTSPNPFQACVLPMLALRSSPNHIQSTCRGSD